MLADLQNYRLMYACKTHKPSFFTAHSPVIPVLPLKYIPVFTTSLTNLNHYDLSRRVCRLRASN